MKTKNHILFTVFTLLSVLILSVSALSFMSSAAENDDPPGYILGDSNSDSKVSITDVTYIQSVLSGKTVPDDDSLYFLAGDIDSSKAVNVVDATYIQSSLSGKKISYPVGTFIPLPTQQTETATEPVETVKPLESINIFFSNNKNWNDVYIYIFDHSGTIEKTKWPGDKMTYKETNEYGEKIYTASVDLTKYDRVIFNDGNNNQTNNTPVSAASSGFFINKRGGTSKADKWVCGVYPYNDTDEGIEKVVTFPYPKTSTHAAYNKKVTVWLPKDYSDTNKYSVLYMLDGQNLTGNDASCAPNEWEADETLISLNSNTGANVILVGIDNTVNRDSELTPPVTDTPKDPTSGKKFTTPTGDVFEGFVVNTVMPYIESTYPTSGINGIAGSSSGGIEAFYIGMENRDKFSYIGALSPAYLLFSENEWNDYLSSLDIADNSMPKIHNYFGNASRDSLEQAIYTYGKDMQSRLINNGYDSSKLLTTTDDDAYHNELFWAITLPETISFGLGYTP